MRVSGILNLSMVDWEFIRFMAHLCSREYFMATFFIKSLASDHHLMSRTFSNQSQRYLL